MTAFDRDGVAADYAAIPAELLAPKPRALSHPEAAAVPLAALSAWQGLFDHGGLAAGERVLIHGATGGVGQFATPLASPPRRPRDRDDVRARRGARTASSAPTSSSTTRPGRGTRASNPSTSSSTPRAASGSPAPPACCARVVGSSRWPRSRLRRAVSRSVYFVVEPNRPQLAQIAALLDGGSPPPAIDSVFTLEEAASAFERSMAADKRGKVVLEVAR